MSVDLIHTDCVDTFFAEAGDVESFLPPLTATAAFEAIAFDPLTESYHETHGGFSHADSQAAHANVLNRDTVGGDARAHPSAGTAREDETDGCMSEAEDDAAARVDAVRRSYHMASPQKRKRKQSVKSASQKRPKGESAGYHDTSDGRCSSPKVADYVLPAPSLGASDDDMKAQRASLLALGNQTLYDLLVQMGGPSRHKAKTARRYVVDEILCRLFPDKAATIKSESLARLTPKLRKPAARDQPSAKRSAASKNTPRPLASRPRQYVNPEASDTLSSLGPSNSDSSDSESFSDSSSESGADGDADVEQIKCRLGSLTSKQLCDLVISLGGPSKHSHNLAKRLLIDYIINTERASSDLRRLEHFLSCPRSSPHKESDLSGQDENILAQLAVLFHQVLSDMMSHADIRNYTTRIQSTCSPNAEGEGGEIETLESLLKKAGEGEYRARCLFETDVDAMLSKTAAGGIFPPAEFNQYKELVKNVMYQQLRHHSLKIRNFEAALRTSASAMPSASGAVSSTEGSEKLGVVLPSGKNLNRNDLPWIEILSVKYHRGDYAYLRGPVSDGPAWVGRIERIYQVDAEHEVDIRWCTSAEHDKYIRSNVRPCGKRELFLMDGPGSVDANSIDTLNGKPVVMLTTADGFRKSGRSKDPSAYYVYRMFNTRTKALDCLPRKAKPNSGAKNAASPSGVPGGKASGKSKTSIKSRGPSAHAEERPASGKTKGSHPAKGPSPRVRVVTAAAEASASERWSGSESDEPDGQRCGSEAESSALRFEAHAPSAASNCSSGGSPPLSRPHLTHLASGLALASPTPTGLCSPSANPRSPLSTANGEVTAALGLIRCLAESNDISRDEEEQWIKLVVTGHEGIVALARYYGSDRSRFVNIARQSFKETATDSAASSTPSQ
eukprot:CAMPEP_0196668410 /NCGR_PEP_ID=MMETSP1086-20130531/65607_1 /TAXON_ID=77921 /ORGANISM="Cyanoptyche  gloeocystis , Strain SAG4.97" /LENGTH=899 /DNA_ID=CAMNT_0042005819 /DNA_START=131 /DNA_END=2830 /DNA_ORIENTATION=+